MKLLILTVFLFSLPAFAGLKEPVYHKSVSDKSLPICFHFGCNDQEIIQVTPREKKRIKELFSTPPKSSQEERKLIAEAIAMFEVYAGSLTPTGKDIAKNHSPTDDWFGQMDCIDETMNINAYLRLIDNWIKLEFHKPGPVLFRAPWIFDQHFATSIVERGSEQVWAIDGWHFDNGHPPVIALKKNWKKKRPY